VEATLEMPFVSSLPVREKSKLAQAWDEFQELKVLMLERGPAIPVGHVATLLGVSRQRVYQWIDDGRLTPFDFHGRTFLFEDEIEQLAKEERKSGRPVAFPSNIFHAAGRAVKAGFAEAKNSSK
jgi:excisionase family DNA binding protein